MIALEREDKNALDNALQERRFVETTGMNTATFAVWVSAFSTRPVMTIRTDASVLGAWRKQDIQGVPEDAIKALVWEDAAFIVFKTDAEADETFNTLVEKFPAVGQTMLGIEVALAMEHGTMIREFRQPPGGQRTVNNLDVPAMGQPISGKS